MIVTFQETNVVRDAPMIKMNIKMIMKIITITRTKKNKVTIKAILITKTIISMIMKVKTEMKLGLRAAS